MRTRNSKPLSLEQGLDLLNGESLKGPLDDLSGGEGLLLVLLWVSTNLVHDFLGQPGGRLVLVSDSLHCSHSLILTTTRDQELWRLVECEEEEPAKEHSECDSTQCQNKVPPAPVVCLGTSFNAFTREVWNVSPSKHTKRVLALTPRWKMA